MIRSLRSLTRYTVGRWNPRKATKGKKSSESTKQIRVKPEKQDKEDKVQPESSSDSERKKKLAVRINIGVCTAFFAVVAIGLLILPRPTISEAEKRNLATFPEFTWDYLPLQ